MDYEARLKQLQDEWNRIYLTLSQPMNRLAYLEGQMALIKELREQELKDQAERQATLTPDGAGRDGDLSNKEHPPETHEEQGQA